MRTTSFLVAGAVFLFAGRAQAAPSGAETRYVDGGKEMRLQRVGPPEDFGHEAPLTPVVVRDPSGHAARAHIDRTAIVRLEPGAELALEARGGRFLRPLMPSIGLYLVEGEGEEDGADFAERLSLDAGAREDGILGVTPNLYLRHKAMAGPHVPTDPRYGGQWYFENLSMPDAWGLTLGDASVTAVVIDTGCDLDHPDLVSKIDPGYDAADDDDDPSFDPAQDGAAHGTACAGIVGAATDNGEGIAGACPECRLRCVRLIVDAPLPTSADVAAFDFALSVDAAVISNSWGYVDSIAVPSPLADAIHEVATSSRGGKGAVVLFAAGNDDREIADNELEALEDVVCVGAINNFDESTPFTNYGGPLDIVAPTGTLTTDIQGTQGDDPSDYTSLFGGTSSACPVAAGIAGLIVSAAPEKTAAEIRDLLRDTARSAPYATPDDSGHDPVYGFGIVDPVKAISVAMGLEAEGGGGAGTGGAGGDASGGAGPGDEDEGGCGCTMVGAAAPPPTLVVTAMACVAFALRPRRRRAR